MIRKIELEKNCTRVESGAVQFGDDWPGISLRGDAAVYFGHVLKNYMEFGKDSGLIVELELKNFAQLLMSCEVKNG